MWTIVGTALSGLFRFGSKIATETTTKTVSAFYLMGKITATSGTIITTAMTHNVFWIVWFTAAFPTALWHGTGMIDSACHGCLPFHTAALPPQIKEYADIVWSNIFWTGAAGYGIQTVSRLAGTLIERLFVRRK